MPPLQSSELAQKEGRVALATQAFQKGQFQSLRAAAKSYDVPLTTLHKRVHGVVARRDLRPPNSKLTLNEESCLEQWILSMDERGLAPRINIVH